MIINNKYEIPSQFPSLFSILQFAIYVFCLCPCLRNVMAIQNDNSAIIVIYIRKQIIKIIICMCPPEEPNAESGKWNKGNKDKWCPFSLFNINKDIHFTSQFALKWLHSTWQKYCEGSFCNFNKRIHHFLTLK